jgi:hypothetical protein
VGESDEVRAVEAAVALASDNDQPSLAQHAEMLARRRLAEAHEGL